jgi:DNA invertase Pin-like site-specific DNA recombinase
MPTAIIYARHSSKDLAKKDLSIPGQLEDCREWCAERGIEVLEEFTDPGVSGRFIERPGLNQVIDFVDENDVDYVVVRFHSRIDRSNEGWIWPTLQMDFNNRGTTLVALDLQEGDSPEIQLSSNVIKSVSSYLMGKMQKDTMRAKITKLRRGEILKTGVPPLGYRFKDTTLEIIPEEAAIIRQMYRIVLDTGHIDPVVKYLDEIGFRTKRGNAARRTTVRKTLVKTTYKGPTYIKALSSLSRQ